MKIWTPIPVETKKALERGECVGQTIQDSPWEVSVESVIGYEFVRDMQIKKTKIFPPSREAIPIVGWLKYMGESAHPNHDDDFLYAKTSDIEYVRFDVPREQIMLSDAIAWEFIMTGEYYSASDTLEALDIELENFQNLNVFERVYTIKRSWERAFDVDPYCAPWVRSNG